MSDCRSHSRAKVPGTSTGRVSYGAVPIWRGPKGSPTGCQGVLWDPSGPPGLAALSRTRAACAHRTARQRERRQVGPKYASAATEGGSWPSFWASLASFSPATLIEQSDSYLVKASLAAFSPGSLHRRTHRRTPCRRGHSARARHL